MMITGFIATTSGALKGVYVFPVLCIILGIAFYVSSFLHNEKWMKLLSLGWWVGAIIMFYFPSIHIILIFAAMMTFFQIIPGLFFYNKYKKEILNRE